MKKKYTLLIIIIIIVLILAITSWVLGSFIQSPAEAAARTKPPVPSAILSRVEKRVLASKVITRGTAHYASPFTVIVAPSRLKPQLSRATRLPERNSMISEGDVVFSASGRPVIILQGVIPVFRDFILGNQGIDITQLEKALARLGLATGLVDGIFDEGTAGGIQQLYQSRGWHVYGLTVVQAEIMSGLEEQRMTALNDLQQAKNKQSLVAIKIKAAEAAAVSRALQDKLTIKKIEDSIENSTGDSRELERLALERQFAQAQEQSNQLSAQLSVQTAREELRQAERDYTYYEQLIARIEKELANLEQASSSQIPADEVIFAPSLPSRVEEVLIDIGDEVAGEVMTLTNNQVVIDSSLTLQTAPLVKPGLPVTIDEPHLGIQARGLVQYVASNPGTDGVDGYHVFFQIQVTESHADLDGVSLRLTIPVQSTAGEVLVVPLSALSMQADGSSRVQVVRADSFEYVKVIPGLSADGFVEIKTGDYPLSTKDQVVIGYEDKQL